MTGYEKVFIDTAPFIYFLDEDENFCGKVKNIFEEILSENKQMISSVVSCEEYLVYPYQTDNDEKAEAFFDFVSDCDIPLVEITVETAKKAASIRAKYPNFKAMDALQLAAACVNACDLFLTNDKQLLQFDEIKCISIEGWDLEES